MTDEQINQQIAEACGWKIFSKPLTGCGFAAYAKSPNGDPSPGVPEYCSDLNAMHEAEKMLTYEQCAFFRTHLRERIEDHAASLFVWHATARQRAEAFLRTLGKWEEVQG